MTPCAGYSRSFPSSTISSVKTAKQSKAYRKKYMGKMCVSEVDQYRRKHKEDV